jgi:hypothetical protein
MSPSMMRRNLFLAASLAFLVGASSVHCGSNGTGNTGASTNTGGSGNGGAGATTSSSSSTGNGMGGDLGNFDAGGKEDVSQDAFYQNDPPPMTCNTDAGATPPVITGTVECPSDKNLPGCPCDTAGQTAACWTGLRKDRGHGVCHDGMTTCQPTGEAQQLAWGDCIGEQLPTGTTGKAACECFSGGHWQIDNLSPCFISDGTTTIAIATQVVNGAPACPDTTGSGFPPPPPVWSKDTLTVDCTGYFKLCYTIKAGDPKNPQPTDCTVVQVCTQDYYKVANMVQPMPDLLGWVSDASASACVQQFMNTGGYGEMSVDGQSDLCEKVQKVFQRVTYCPLSCNDPNPPAECSNCMAGGGGNF